MNDTPTTLTELKNQNRRIATLARQCEAMAGAVMTQRELVLCTIGCALRKLANCEAEAAAEIQ